MSLRSIREDWRVIVAVVSGGHFLSHFYILAFPPLFPLLAREFTLSNAQLGLIVSLISAATLLQLVVGGVVDRMGARRVFVAGLVLTSIGVVLAGFASSYLALLAFVSLSGLGQSTFHPADYALLDGASDAANQGKSFSLHTFGGYAGFAAAPVVVGSLALWLGWNTALVAVGIVGLVYAGLAVVALEPDHRASRDAEADTPAGGMLAALLQPTILVLFGFFAVLTATQFGIQTFTAVLAVDGFQLSEAAGNATLTAFLVLAAIGVLVGGPIADRHPPRRVIVPFLLVGAATTWLVVSRLLPGDTLTTAGLFGLIGFCSGVVLPARDRLVSAFSTEGSVGRSFGFVFTGISVAGLVAPVVLGAVIDVTTVWHAFALIGGLFVAAAAITLAIGAGHVPSSTAVDDEAT